MERAALARLTTRPNRRIHPSLKRAEPKNRGLSLKVKYLVQMDGTERKQCSGTFAIFSMRVQNVTLAHESSP
jgi:hypothetical protein